MSAPNPYEPHHVHAHPCEHCDDGYTSAPTCGPTLNESPPVPCPECDGTGIDGTPDCDCNECAERYPEWFAANVEAPRGWEVG